MFNTRSIVEHFATELQDAKAKIRDLEYNVKRLEGDLVTYHNEQEDDINALKEENAKLRSDLVALLHALGAHIEDIEAQPAARRVVIRPRA